MSHFAFVNPGGPLVPDLAKAKRYGITRLYWQANDPQLSAGLLSAIRDRSMEVGIMRDPSWQKNTASDLAWQLDSDLVRLGSDNSQCAVLADIEYHDPEYIIEFLHEWRILRPTRVTSWTLEPLQGGWMTEAFARVVARAGVGVYPQAYYGNMSPVAEDLCRADLIECGFIRAQVGVVYRALTIPTHWDGIAFPFHELP